MCLLNTYLLTCLHGDVGRSTNLGGRVVMHGPNLPALVEIGLTDLPKTGGGERGERPPVPSLPTSLNLIFKVLKTK